MQEWQWDGTEIPLETQAVGEKRTYAPTIKQLTRPPLLQWHLVQGLVNNTLQGQDAIYGNAGQVITFGITNPYFDEPPLLQHPAQQIVQGLVNNTLVGQGAFYGAGGQAITFGITERLLSKLPWDADKWQYHIQTGIHTNLLQGWPNQASSWTFLPYPRTYTRPVEEGHIANPIYQALSITSVTGKTYYDDIIFKLIPALPHHTEDLINHTLSGQDIIYGAPGQVATFGISNPYFDELPLLQYYLKSGGPIPLEIAGPGVSNYADIVLRSPPLHQDYQHSNTFYIGYDTIYGAPGQAITFGVTNPYFAVLPILQHHEQLGALINFFGDFPDGVQIYAPTQNIVSLPPLLQYYLEDLVNHTLLGQDIFYGAPGQAITFGITNPYFGRLPILQAYIQDGTEIPLETQAVGSKIAAEPTPLFLPPLHQYWQDFHANNTLFILAPPEGKQYYNDIIFQLRNTAKWQDHIQLGQHTNLLRGWPNQAFSWLALPFPRAHYDKPLQEGYKTNPIYQPLFAAEVSGKVYWDSILFGIRPLGQDAAIANLVNNVLLGQDTIYGAAGQAVTFGITNPLRTRLPLLQWHIWDGTEVPLTTQAPGNKIAADPLPLTRSPLHQDYQHDNVFYIGYDIIYGNAGQSVTFGITNPLITKPPLLQDYIQLGGYIAAYQDLPDGVSIYAPTTQQLTYPPLLQYYLEDLINHTLLGQDAIYGAGGQSITFGITNPYFPTPPILQWHRWPGTEIPLTTQAPGFKIAADPLPLVRPPAHQDFQHDNVFYIGYDTIYDSPGQSVTFGITEKLLTKAPLLQDYIRNGVYLVATEDLPDGAQFYFPAIHRISYQPLIQYWTEDLINHTLLGQDIIYGSPGQSVTFGTTQPYFDELPLLQHYMQSGGYILAFQDLPDGISLYAPTTQQLTRPPLAQYYLEELINHTLLGQDTIYGAAGQSITFGVTQPYFDRLPLLQYHLANGGEIPELVEGVGENKYFDPTISILSRLPLLQAHILQGLVNNTLSGQDIIYGDIGQSVTFGITEKLLSRLPLLQDYIIFGGQILIPIEAVGENKTYDPTITILSKSPLLQEYILQGLVNNTLLGQDIIYGNAGQSVTFGITNPYFGRLPLLQDYLANGGEIPELIEGVGENKYYDPTIDMLSRLPLLQEHIIQGLVNNVLLGQDVIYGAAGQSITFGITNPYFGKLPLLQDFLANGGEIPELIEGTGENKHYDPTIQILSRLPLLQDYILQGLVNNTLLGQDVIYGTAGQSITFGITEKLLSRLPLLQDYVQLGGYILAFQDLPDGISLYMPTTQQLTYPPLLQYHLEDLINHTLLAQDIIYGAAGQAVTFGITNPLITIPPLLQYYILQGGEIPELIEAIGENKYYDPTANILSRLPLLQEYILQGLVNNTLQAQDIIYGNPGQSATFGITERLLARLPILQDYLLFGGQILVSIESDGENKIYDPTIQQLSRAPLLQDYVLQGLVNNVLVGQDIIYGSPGQAVTFGISNPYFDELPLLQHHSAPGGLILVFGDFPDGSQIYEPTLNILSRPPLIQYHLEDLANHTLLGQDTIYGNAGQAITFGITNPYFGELPLLQYYLQNGGYITAFQDLPDGVSTYSPTIQQLLYPPLIQHHFEDLINHTLLSQDIIYGAAGQSATFGITQPYFDRLPLLQHHSNPGGLILIFGDFPDGAQIYAPTIEQLTRPPLLQYHIWFGGDIPRETEAPGENKFYDPTIDLLSIPPLIQHHIIQGLVNNTLFGQDIIYGAPGQVVTFGVTNPYFDEPPLLQYYILHGGDIPEIIEGVGENKYYDPTINILSLPPLIQHHIVQGLVNNVLFGQDVIYGDPGQVATFGITNPYFPVPPMHQDWEFTGIYTMPQVFPDGKIMYNPTTQQLTRPPLIQYHILGLRRITQVISPDSIASVEAVSTPRLHIIFVTDVNFLEATYNITFLEATYNITFLEPATYDITFLEASYDVDLGNDTYKIDIDWET